MRLGNSGAANDRERRLWGGFLDTDAGLRLRGAREQGCMLGGEIMIFLPGGQIIIAFMGANDEKCCNKSSIA